MLQNMSLVSSPTVMVSASTPICFEIPKMVYDECFLVSDNNTNTFTQQRKGIDVSMSSISVETHFKLFNIFNERSLHENIYGSEKDPSLNKWNNSFSAIALLIRSNSWSYSDIAYQAVSSQDRAISTVALLHYYSKKASKNYYMNVLGSDKASIEIEFSQFGMVYEDSSRLRYS